jgi:hypothetical protein
MANTFKNAVVTNITTQTGVITSGGQVTVIGLSLANTTASQITGSIEVTKGGTTGYMVKNAIIEPGGALIAIGGDQKVVLESGNILKVTASGTVDVIVSYLEIT